MSNSMRRGIALALAAGSLLLGISLNAAAQGFSTSSTDNRSGPEKLDPAWTIDISDGNSIELKEGIVEIHAAANTYAHIQRSLDSPSGFRVSASIKSPPCANWATSLFLYWKPFDWIQMGYIASHHVYHFNGPGIYAVVMTNGKREDNRLTTTSSDQYRYNAHWADLERLPIDTMWQNVAIAVGEDSIYFQICRDGERWETEMIIPREGAMKESPKLLIVGKGMADPQVHPAADLNNDSADRGELTTSSVESLQIVKVSEDLLKASKVSLEHFLDIPGREELDKPGDPTFASVASHWPPLQYSREVIGISEHPHEIAILSNGQLGYEHGRAWFTVGSEPMTLVLSSLPKKRLERGWLPIVTAEWNDNGLLCEQTAFGWSDQMSPDTTFQTYVRMTVRNTTPQEKITRLAVFDDRKQKEVLEWSSLVLPGNVEKVVYLRGAFPDKEGFKPVKIESTEFDARLEEVADWWELKVNRGMKIDVPEPRILDAWRAWLAYLYINVDKKGDCYEIHDGGGGFYEAVFGFSAAQVTQVLDQLGRTDDAQAYLNSMTQMGSPEGLFVINFGLPDHGSLLRTLCQHYEMTGDREWLKSVAPTLVNMCKWIKNARDKEKARQDPEGPIYGMIKGRPYCDHAEHGYYLLADITMATGMAHAAEVLAEIGQQSEAAWIAKEASAYREDLKKVLERAVFSVEGQKLLPLFPETRELLRAVRWMTSDYYSASVGSLLEIEGDIVPPQSSPYTQIVVDSLEQRGGLLMGLCRFWGGIDHAYTSGYWYNRLVNGEPEKALLGLYGSLAYGMSRDTFASVEVTFCKKGMNFATLPHTYSMLHQLRLVRNLLVLEQGDTLVLGAGIARHWLANGEHVEVEDAATLFGDVSYRMDSKVEEGRIVVRIDPPDRKPPKTLRVWLRHPQEAPIHSVAMNGKPVPNIKAEREWLEIPCPDKPTTLEVLF